MAGGGHLTLGHETHNQLLRSPSRIGTASSPPR